MHVATDDRARARDLQNNRGTLARLLALIERLPRRWRAPAAPIWK
jgi:hypothetical protein